jgi:hypothetical protein
LERDTVRSLWSCLPPDRGGMPSASGVLPGRRDKFHLVSRSGLEAGDWPTGAALWEGGSGREVVTASVVALVFALEVVGPVGVEVTAGVQGAELGDGFGGVGAPAGR